MPIYALHAFKLMNANAMSSQAYAHLVSRNHFHADEYVYVCVYPPTPEAINN